MRKNEQKKNEFMTLKRKNYIDDFGNSVRLSYTFVFFQLR